MSSSPGSEHSALSPRRRASARPSSLGRLVLSREALLDRGVTSRRLASSEFTRVFPGFYTLTEVPAGVRQMCHVLQTQVLPGVVLSHTTAAALMGIALPASADGGIAFHLPRVQPGRIDSRTGAAVPRNPLQPPLHVRVPAPHHPAAGPRVRVHRGTPELRLQHDGFLVSHPLEVLWELAGLLGHSDLVAAVDSILSPRARQLGGGRHLLTRAAIREHVAAAPAGRRGSRALRRALSDAREGVESPAETYARLLIVAAGFPEPTVNLPVLDVLSGKIRRIDGAYEAQRVGIEFDGDVHRTGRSVWREDEKRRDGLAASGWLLRRMTGADLVHPDEFLTRLHRSCTERGVPVPPVGSWRGRVLLEGAMDYSGRMAR